MPDLWVYENIIIIGVSSETSRRPIGDPSETDLPDRRFIRDRHAWSETNRRPTCLIGDRHASSETDMSDWRPIRDTWVSSEACQSPIRHVGHGLRWVFDEACRSPIRHAGLRLVSCQACWSPMGLWSDMSVSDGSPIGLRWVFDRSPIILIFSWTPNLFKDVHHWKNMLFSRGIGFL